MPELCVVHEGQRDQHDRRDQRADDDKRRAAAALAPMLVGDRAEQRQHKQRQHIIQRHDHTRPGLGHTELVGQNQGDRVVVGLPERADEKERKAHKNCAFVIQLHILSSSWRYMVPILGNTHVG